MSPTRNMTTLITHIMDNQLKKIALAAVMVFAAAGSLFSQTVPSSGVVISSTDDLPVIGAIVYEEGNTSNGVTTDADGRFLIQVPVGANIVVSCMGYREMTFIACICRHDYCHR